MPKIAKELTAMEVKRLNTPGWHAVGGVAGLLLQIREPSHQGARLARSWVLRLRNGGRRQLIGLGSYSQVTLAEAREQARSLSADARAGIDLLTRKRAQQSALITAASKAKTFAECAEAYMEAHATDYSNEKHRKQWASTLSTYAYPLIGRALVADVERSHVLNVLMQETNHRNGTNGKLWYTKSETAKRLLDRMRKVLDYATAADYRSGPNPAAWKGYLETQLPSPKGLKKVKHHPAVPYAKVGDFMACLRTNTSISAAALEFLILTSVRSGSVRLATWAEIDLLNRNWTIPAAHTKTKEIHVVPLSDQAIRLLERMPRMAGTDLIFSGTKGTSLSDMALNQLMRGMRERGELEMVAVPHGFRSTFRDWAAEQTGYPDEIRKAASGHSVGDGVKGSYQRSDLLEKRRELMEQWGDFLDRPSVVQTATVSPIRGVK